MQSSSVNPVNFLDQWKPLRIIGSGSTCDVYLVQDNESNTKKVIKIFNSNVKQSVAAAEAQLLMSLNHPRILSASGYFPKVSLSSSDDMLSLDEKIQYVTAIALEYAPNGDLLDLIQSVGRLPENLAKTYFLQLLDAIEYLHEKNICHLDIKPDNILVDENNNMKLADFGVAAQIPKNCTVKGVVGTSIYHSPEILARQAYNPYQADLFALGITLFTMVTGNIPFQSAQLNDPIYKLIIEGSFEGFWEIHESMRAPDSTPFSEEFKSLIEGMLCADAKCRLSLERIKRHAWVKIAVSSSEEQAIRLMDEIFNNTQYSVEAQDTEILNFVNQDAISAAC